jgi:hypothetical protein
LLKAEEKTLDHKDKVVVVTGTQEGMAVVWVLVQEEWCLATRNEMCEKTKKIAMVLI